jgi:hypothetical protein
MIRWYLFVFAVLTLCFSQSTAPTLSAKNELKAGAAAVVLTPFGQNADWDGTVTPNGVWGEKFEDKNGNGVWDSGEPFEDDPGNTELDPSSKNKYDGIYLAGFGQKRLATGKHDDLWARTIVLEYGATKLAVVSVDFIGYYSEAASKKFCSPAPTATKARTLLAPGAMARSTMASIPSISALLISKLPKASS